MIRKGRPEDLPRVFELIVELAHFERAAHEVTNTVAQMERDGFGPSPLFGFFVAEDETGIHGISLYYYRYSTWKGKRLYLEDIIVTEQKRGLGLGKALFDATMNQAVQDNCTGMMWQVLDWNEAAIAFYKSYGSRLDAEWVNCHLETNQIKQLLQNR
ncbi:MAG: GNAT family N-acetyltransferase [Cyclobacteriaceae bacterium]|nr:MAG: GNAT family N-acetyltransferase [Cyclobacteriaceae bacterium]